MRPSDRTSWRQTSRCWSTSGRHGAALAAWWRPVVDELADEYEGRVKVVKVNTDENVDTIVRYGVQSIPTLVLFKNGKPLDHVVGFRPKSELQRLLDDALIADTVSATRN